MKLTLMLLLCSVTQNDCLPPYRWPEQFNSTYDCMIAGYEESIIKMEEIGRSEINQHGIYMKFDCQPYILPEKKPVGQPVLYLP